MKVVFLGGNSHRHFYVARSIQNAVGLAGLVVEEREAFVPVVPQNLDAHLSGHFVKHFDQREKAELSFFGEGSIAPFECPILKLSKSELNAPKLWDFLEKIKPDLVISYGVHKLTDETLSHCPPDRWNSHGGLSPAYRGVTTHFWPSYMLEPQMTGVTLHQLTSKLDAGEIVHQTVAPLVLGDGIHQLACRTVHQYGIELGDVLKLRMNGKAIQTQAQKYSGKLWLEKDWRPEHLRLIYDTYNNRIVDAYIGNQLSKVKPVIYSQFALKKG